MAAKKPQKAPEATPEQGDSLEEAIAKLTPEQAEMFMKVLEHTMKKRRFMLIGNLLAVLLMIAGTLVAFSVYGAREPGRFTGWVFLVPFGSAGFVLWIFGKLARRAGIRTESVLERGASQTLGARS